MSAIVKIEDIKEVIKDCGKLLKTNTYNEWEEKFITDMVDIVDLLDVALSTKQIYNIYKAYYKHVENDCDSFDEWCTRFGFRTLLADDYDKWVIAIK